MSKRLVTGQLLYHSYRAHACGFESRSELQSPRVVAINRGKVINRRDTNPSTEVVSWKVVGSNPGAGEIFFL